MWDNIKNDKLIKTMSIMILGVLGFGLAFQIVFGQNNMDMGQGSSVMAFVMMVFMKLLTISLVISIGMLSFNLIKKHVIEEQEFEIPMKFNSDWLYKTIVVIISVIFTMALIHVLMSMIMGIGMGIGFGIGAISVVIIKFLMVLLVVCFFISMIAGIKHYYFKE